MSVAKAPFTRMSSSQLSKSNRPLRIMVLGQGGVGKSVRFITRRYIGEYDPTLEKLYTFSTAFDGEMTNLEILDTAGQPHESECPTLEANIRWAEAFVLMYSVTDKCSFDECNRLKFLINYNKRRRRLTSKVQVEAPVVLVGNKSDQIGDRMITTEEGSRRSADIGCANFHEISVRENIEEVWDVFRDVVRSWRSLSRCPKLKRSTSEIPEQTTSFSSTNDSENNLSQSTSGQLSRTSPVTSTALARRWTELGTEELDQDEEEESRDCLLPFRGRASTDGTLLVTRPRRRWRYPSPGPPPNPTVQDRLTDRRMSISMRGTSSNTAF